jgi:hypothetical protein
MPKRKRKTIVAPQRYGIELDDVRVGDVEGKGTGVIAVNTLPPNSQLLYEGKEINAEQKAKLARKTNQDGKEDYASYILSSGRAGVWIDGHPRRQGNGALFANLINEPSTGQTANMVLKHRKEGAHLEPVLITTREIKPGEELMFKYDNAFKRVGYRAGRKAIEPKWLKPKEN